MNLRTVVRTTVAAGAAFAFSLTGSIANAQQKKPNIVIIWGDDIGQSDISAYSMGLMGFHTPNIDRVAREGMIFTDYYANRAAPLVVHRSLPVNLACAPA